ncbi:unnamed protein product [Amoebophrya sp. A25]|nr:unnamed protein product [Amoebophrya sp. A25]|eukprot:GSA25T00020842001.1
MIARPLWEFFPYHQVNCVGVHAGIAAFCAYSAARVAQRLAEFEAPKKKAYGIACSTGAALVSLSAAGFWGRHALRAVCDVDVAAEVSNLGEKSGGKNRASSFLTTVQDVDESLTLMSPGVGRSHAESLKGRVTILDEVVGRDSGAMFKSGIRKTACRVSSAVSRNLMTKGREQKEFFL